MLFIHPMWSHESQRIGKRLCTPMGYALHVIAEGIGFLGLLFLLAVPATLGWTWFAGTFGAGLWWLFTVPFGLGIVSEVLFQYSWWLAWRKRLPLRRRAARGELVRGGPAPHIQVPGRTKGGTCRDGP